MSQAWLSCKGCGETVLHHCFRSTAVVWSLKAGLLRGEFHTKAHLFLCTRHLLTHSSGLETAGMSVLMRSMINTTDLGAQLLPSTNWCDHHLKMSCCLIDNVVCGWSPNTVFVNVLTLLSTVSYHGHKMSSKVYTKIVHVQSFFWPATTTTKLSKILYT